MHVACSHIRPREPNARDILNILNKNNLSKKQDPGLRGALPGKTLDFLDVYMCFLCFLGFSTVLPRFVLEFPGKK